MLSEIRNQALRNSKQAIIANLDEINKAYDIVMKFHRVTKEEGLLALEEFASYLREKDPMEGNFYRMIQMIVAGMEAERISELATNIFWVNGYEGISAVVFYLYARGALLIQRGNSARELEDLFNSVIPFEVSSKSAGCRYFNVQATIFNERLQKRLDDIQNSISDEGRDFVDRFEERLRGLDEDAWDMLTSRNGFCDWETLIPYVSTKTRALMSAHMNFERVHCAYVMGRISDEVEIRAACEEFDDLVNYLERITARDYMDAIGNITLLKSDEVERLHNLIPDEDLAMALKGCSPRMRVRILDKLGDRNAYEISYLMECMGPVRLNDVEQAQESVLKAIFEVQKR